MEFIKMQAIGNDYIYLFTNQKIENLNELSEKLSKRRFSIGGDGLVVVSDSEVADRKMRIFNSDGSEAEMCGNAIRCVAKYLYESKAISCDIVTIETKAGVKTLFLTIENGKVSLVKVNMGEASFSPMDIPMLITQGSALNYVLPLPRGDITVSSVSVGNPHTVLFVDSLDIEDFEERGKQIENHYLYPNRTNVEFVKILNRNEVEMRVYERGAKETLGCGTGATAVVAVTTELGLTDDKVKVKLKGGELFIEKQGKTMFMSGDAHIVYKGII